MKILQITLALVLIAISSLSLVFLLCNFTWEKKERRIRAQLKAKFAETFPNAEEELKVDTYRTLYEEDSDNTPDVVDSWYGIEPDDENANSIDFVVTYGEEGAMAIIIFADGHLAHYGCQDDNDDADIDQCIDALSMDVPDDDDED